MWNPFWKVKVIEGKTAIMATDYLKGVQHTNRSNKNSHIHYDDFVDKYHQNDPGKLPIGILTGLFSNG